MKLIHGFIKETKSFLYVLFIVFRTVIYIVGAGIAAHLFWMFLQYGWNLL